jgi:hypothetical protein
MLFLSNNCSLVRCWDENDSKKYIRYCIFLMISRMIPSMVLSVLFSRWNCVDFVNIYRDEDQKFLPTIIDCLQLDVQANPSSDFGQTRVSSFGMCQVPTQSWWSRHDGRGAKTMLITKACQLDLSGFALSIQHEGKKSQAQLTVR